MKRTPALLLIFPAFISMNTAVYCQDLPAESAAPAAKERRELREAASPSAVAALSPATDAPLASVAVATVPVSMPAPIPTHGASLPQLRSSNPAQRIPVKKATQASSLNSKKSAAAKHHGATPGKSPKRQAKATAGAATKSANAKAKKETGLSTRIISSTAISKKDGSDEKFVALTFDDGPAPDYTPQILALLKQYGIHATFCLVGRQVKKYPELVKQIAAEGHKIAAHSMNHDERLSWRSDKKIKQEILGEKALIQSLVPDAPVDYYRAPGGAWNHHIRKLVASWGMKPLGWSVDSKDWQQPGVDSIISTVNKQLHSGGVILMHDAGGNRSETVAALKQLIPTLKKDGYQFAFPE